MAGGASENPQASVERVRQEVERWMEVARTAGERTLEAIGLTPISRCSLPAVDVLETSAAVEVWVDVPGLSSDAVQLTATETQLTVKLARPAAVEPEGKFHLRERPSGVCERTINLSTSVDPDQTKAELRDGLLHVTLGKQISHAPRTVPVNVT